MGDSWMIRLTKRRYQLRRSGISSKISSEDIAERILFHEAITDTTDRLDVLPVVTEFPAKSDDMYID